MFLSELITRGGPVLYLLFILTLIIFYILFNKYSFIFFDKKTWSSSKLDKFIDENPPETTKLFFVEKTFLSEFRRDSFSNIKLLDGLIGMCPMIGLLGTVYGMIEVFEVLSFLGTGNPRAMSILKSVLAAHPENKFHLVYGNKTIEETMFYATLKTLEKDYNGRLSITWVFSQANEEGAFFGRIDQAIVKNYLNKETEDVGAYYLCGPKTMIETTTAVLQEKGVVPEAILSELFVTTPTSEISAGEENQLTIVCDGVEHSLDNKEGRTILDAALQEKIDVPYSCQGGVCCSCIARIESGSAKMESNQILSDDEVEEGLILTCQALVTSPSIRVNYDDV